MDGWFRIWWRRVGRDDGQHSIALYQEIIQQWNVIGERLLVRGAVFERRGLGEDGQQISEICVHKDVLFFGGHLTHRNVFLSANQEDLRIVEAFWKARSLKTFGDESRAYVQKWLRDNEEVDYSVAVSTELLNAYPFAMTPPRRVFEV